MRNLYKFLVALAFFTISSFYLFAQVGINTDNSDPDPSAGLDVKFDNKGFLPPRMTFEQRNSIQNPVEGLMVFCTNCDNDGTGVISIFKGGKWHNMTWGCTTPVTPANSTHLADATQITWNWNAVPIAIGYKWNTVNNYATATDMVAATIKIETGLTCQTNYNRYAWAYNDCGESTALTMTQATQQIPLANSPVTGTHSATTIQIVWNWNTVVGATGYKWSATNNFATATNMGTEVSKTETELICNTAYTRYVWAYDGCGNSTATTLTQTTNISPDAPLADTHVPSTIQIIWNWNTVSGATGYKWNTVDDYASATNMDTTVTKTETGLTCGSAYTRYVWAYNTCGNSSAVSLTQSTTLCCGTEITINHIEGVVAPVTKSVTYGIVTNIPGEPAKCWITRNLGASQQATVVSDNTEASAGWYFQFNLKQGYQYISSRIPASTWISSINESSDWTTGNDPCTIELGTGWRIPTNTEWTNVAASGSWTNWNGPFGSALKLHAAGGLTNSDGSLYNRGSRGYCWSSARYDDANGWYLYFLSSNIYMNYVNGKSNGFPVRCVRD